MMVSFKQRGLEFMD